MRNTAWKTMFIASAVAFLAITAVYTIPLGRHEDWILHLGTSQPQAVELAPHTTVTQTIPAPSTKFSAIEFFATDQRLSERTLHVRILDNNGKELARSYGFQQSYFEDHLKITALIPWLKITPGQRLVVEIRLVSGQPLHLLGIETNSYKKYPLQVNNQVVMAQVLPMQIVKPVTSPSGLRQGVLVGTFFLMALSLLQFLKPRQRAWGAGLLLIASTPLALAGFWYSRGFLGIDDWDYYFSLHTVWREIILHWHQFPFWNPFTCGGTAGLGDPEFSVFTPSYLLEFIFGIPNGLRLAIYFATAIGSLGMFKLARRLGHSVEASLVAALAISFGSVNLLEMVEGHVNIFASMWVPWIFWSWFAAYKAAGQNKLIAWIRPTKFTVICSIFLSITFYQGGIYLLLYTLLAFLVLPWLTKYPLAAIRTTVVSGIWALGLAAVKIFPVLLWLHEFPDKAYASSPNSFFNTMDILFGRHLHRATIVPNQVAGWYEYGAYVGYIVLALALLGLLKWRRNRIVRGLAVATILAWLLSTAGPLLEPFFDKAPFLPRSMITRVIFYSVIPMSLLAGYGLDWFRSKFRSGILLTPIIVGLVAIDVMSLSYQLSEQAFIVPDLPAPIAPAPTPIAFIRTTHYAVLPDGEKHIRQYPYTLAGYGEMNYCSVLGPNSLVKTIEDENSSIITTDPVGQKVILNYWSPNIVRAQITASKPSTVILNTNYGIGWSANGQPVLKQEGRVATEIPSGTHDVTFTYKTPGFSLGLFVTILSILASAYFATRHNQEPTNKSQTKEI